MDARQRDVLIALIREYVDSAEPVGSRVLSKRHFPHLSPATIRNVMADLEEMGYLAQPHTSAGRIPTDKAYRFYVDSFPPPSSAGKPGGAALPTRRSGIDGFMERTSSHLSTVTRLTGLLLAPPLAQTVIARVDLMPLEEDRALAVVATDAGWITVREIVLDPPLAAEEARNIGRELTRRFRNRSVEEIVAMESAPTDPLDALHTDLMTSLSGDAGVRVTIGEENPVDAMRECTLITSTYLYRDQVLGILGVVGPRRLPYPEVMSIVNETARQVTEALSRVRQDLYLPS